jgi:hypothetical protein
MGRRTSPLPKGETNTPAANSAATIQPERLRFRELLLGNPNYFGTAPDTELPPVVELAAQTTYEELTCVGLQPGVRRVLDRLGRRVGLRGHRERASA